VVDQPVTATGLAARSSITIWSRRRPATEFQLPMAMSLEPSGVMSNLSTSTVPVWATALTVLKVPPMWSRRR
jgi:hypothetical protein